MRERLSTILFELKNGVVVVEGKHDVAVMERLGICTSTYERVMRGGLTVPEGAKVFILTDDDRRGSEKADAVSGFLSGSLGPCRLDRETGLRLLDLCNATSVEQVSKPIEKIMEGS